MASKKRKKSNHFKKEKATKNSGGYQASVFKRDILSILIFTLAVLFVLGLFDLAGQGGFYLSLASKFIFGWGAWLFPIVLIILGYFVLKLSSQQKRFHNFFGLFLAVLSYSGIFQLIYWLIQNNFNLEKYEGGGYLGFYIAYPLRKLIGLGASFIVLLALLLISLLLMGDISLNQLFKKRFKEKELLPVKEDKEEKGKEAKKIVVSPEKETKIRQKLLPDLKLRKKEKKEEDEIEVFSGKEMPSKRIDLPLDLLEKTFSQSLSSGDIENNKKIIQKTLESFGIPVEMREVSIGPTVTQYTLKPAEGVKLSQITTLHNDLALALAAHPIRIEAPIPGKSLVGIEVPNRKIAVVGLREILEDDAFKKRKSNLTLALGRDVAGRAYLADLGRMPHLLVAGATGSGKTVCLNSIIIGLLYQNSFQDLKFILIDPKRVELTVYEGIPHLLTSVVTDVRKTINALKWAISEMERRFELLNQAGKRDIHSYNQERKEERMPYIVIVIDELADLMVSSPAEVEACIIRLAQMARAVGIHLVMATQRPSVDIITGLIKANITSRIAFSVASATDSRTILDVSGAEKLLGRGDMLYTSAQLSKPIRLQGAYVSDKSIKKVVEYLKERAKPEYISEITQPSVSSFGGVFDEEDELLPQAKEVVWQAKKASASLLQRRLRIGYARAARLLDILEEKGIIGPADGAKPREVLKYEDDYSSDTNEEEINSFENNNDEESNE